MIQFLTYKRNDKNEIIELGDNKFSIISDNDSVKFFLKRTLYLFLFIYSTLFLAVALPFVKTPFMPIYFVGGMATCFYVARFLNHIIKFIKYRNACLTISSQGAELSFPDNSIKISVGDITYFEHNLLGNFLNINFDVLKCFINDIRHAWSGNDMQQLGNPCLRQMLQLWCIKVFKWFGISYIVNFFIQITDFSAQWF